MTCMASPAQHLSCLGNSNCAMLCCAGLFGAAASTPSAVVTTCKVAVCAPMSVIAPCQQWPADSSAAAITDRGSMQAEQLRSVHRSQRSVLGAANMAGNLHASQPIAHDSTQHQPIHAFCSTQQRIASQPRSPAGLLELLGCSGRTALFGGAQLVLQQRWRCTGVSGLGAVSRHQVGLLAGYVVAGAQEAAAILFCNSRGIAAARMQAA
jgi:hypothetical protein